MAALVPKKCEIQNIVLKILLKIFPFETDVLMKAGFVYEKP
jgi:hypothetical protein